MKKDITPSWCNSFGNEKVVAPSMKTLAFLKQFARSYHVAKELPERLAGVCVN